MDRGEWHSASDPGQIRILGSAHWIMDPDPAPDLDPALFVTVFQETNKNEFFSYVFLAYYLRVADPDPGSGAFLTPWDGIRDGKNPDSGWISCIIFPRAEKHLFWLKIFKFFDADPGRDLLDPGFGIFLTLDPGWKKFVSRIRDKEPRFEHCKYIIK